MKTLIELDPGECKFALTDSETADKSWSHLRLGANGPGMRAKNGSRVGAGAYPHLFCGAPAIQVRGADGKMACGPYCEAHHKVSYRGKGKDARSLEEMIYSIDHSQYRGRAPYAEHTDPMDEELKKGAAA